MSHSLLVSVAPSRGPLTTDLTLSGRVGGLWQGTEGWGATLGASNTPTTLPTGPAMGRLCRSGSDYLTVEDVWGREKLSRPLFLL